MFRWMKRWFSGHSAAASQHVRETWHRRFAIEPLEKRHMLTVAFNPIHMTYEAPNNKDILIPLTSAESANAAVSYSVQSNSSGVTASIINSGTFLKISVSGKDGSNQNFTGDLVFQLFDDLTPETVNHITTLVQQAFFTNVSFHRVDDGDFTDPNGRLFVQGGGGSSGSLVDNEFVTSLTYNSPGLIAMARTNTPDTNDGQVFIINDGNDLAHATQAFNYQYTIFGQLVDGFDVLEKMLATPLTGAANSTTPASPLTWVSSAIVTNNSDRILRVHVPAGVTGAQSVTVRATSAGDATTADQTFTVNAVADTVTDPAFIPNQPATRVTDQGTPITITAGNLDATSLTFNVVGVDNGGPNSTNTSAASNVTFSASGNTLTITPNASFVGTTRLRVTLKGANSGFVDQEDFNLTVLPRVSLSISPTNGQFNENAGTATVLASIAGTFSQSVTVPVNFSVAPGTDYQASSTSILIAAGQTSGSITLTGINDNIQEGNESFTVSMGTITGGLQANSSATTVSAVIVDDEAQPTVTLSASPTTFSENGGSSKLTATISNPSVNPTIINLTFGGTATAGTDYTSFTQIAIPAGQTSASITISGIDDTLLENDETIVLGVSGVTNGSFATTFSQTLTITSDETAPQNITIDSSSDDGVSNSDHYTSNGTPKLTVSATAGQTLEFLVNGVVVGSATDSSSSGSYSLTLADGNLKVGDNTLTARIKGSTQTASAMTLTYAPDNSKAYHVTGDVGSDQSVSFSFNASNAGYKNEVGVYVASDSKGTINGLLPGDDGYAQAALSSSTRRVLFANGTAVGADQVITLTGGQVLGFYMIQLGTTDAFLTHNPNNTIPGQFDLGGPVAFFSFDAANPDGVRHVQVVGDALGGSVEYRWEDLTGGGDQDFNDFVFSVNPNANGLQPTLETLRVPAGNSVTVATTFTLGAGQQAAGSSNNSFSSLGGEFGIFKVSDDAGTVNGLAPGDAGYLAAALAASNRQNVFSSGSAAGATSTLNLTGRDLYGYFYVPNGTASDVLSTNPNNSATDSVYALLSFDSANPDDTDHFRWSNPEQASQSSTNDTMNLHVMDALYGSESDFDKFMVSIHF